MGKSTALRKVDKVEVLAPATAGADLAVHEAVIERGMSSFIEVGNALKAIRDGREYRDLYPTFEEYCRKRWNWSRSYAHRNITEAELAVKLLPIGNKTPITESLLRPIVSLEFDVQRKVWQKAIETAPEGKLTAKIVSAIAAEYKPKPKVKKSNPDTINSVLWKRIGDAIRKIMLQWKYEERHELAEELRNFADIVDDARRETMK
jgi:hypothetical protein